MYVMNVGLDMRLVNTNTLEVADVISYQKQIVGRQVTAGIFDFLGTNFFDVSAGESALEPIQLAVRSVIERAVLEMVTRIYRAPGGACASPIGTAADPLADAGDRPYPYAQQAYAQPYPHLIRSLIRTQQPYQQPYTTLTSPTTRRTIMTLRVKTLIAATALATLSATCAYAEDTDQYGTWNDGAMRRRRHGSQINTSQVNTQTNWSNLNGNIDTVAGDAAVQGAAGGNLMDITTMNNTMVNNSQIVGPGAAIGSNISHQYQQYRRQRRHPEPGALQRRQRLDRSDPCLDPFLPGMQRGRSVLADQRQCHQHCRRRGVPGFLARQYLRGGLQRPEHADLEQADQQFARWLPRSTPMSTISAARPA